MNVCVYTSVAARVCRRVCMYVSVECTRLWAQMCTRKCARVHE